MKPLRVILELSKPTVARYIQQAHADHNSKPVAPEDKIFQSHGNGWVKNDARLRKFINRSKGIKLATNNLIKEK